MISKFSTYLKNIALEEPIINKIDSFIRFYTSLNKGTINDIFVNNFFNGDKSIGYQSVWLFTNRYFFEVDNFLSSPRFDMACYFKNIDYWDLKMTDYSFDSSATDSSGIYLRLQLHSQPNVESIFKAVGANCNYFKQIFLNRLLPNFI